MGDCLEDGQNRGRNDVTNTGRIHLPKAEEEEESGTRSVRAEGTEPPNKLLKTTGGRGRGGGKTSRKVSIQNSCQNFYRVIKN